MSVGKINNVSDSNLGKVVSLSSSNIGKIGVGLFTDEYTKLLLHMDGVGNTFIDSATNKTVNTRGNVTQSTTQSKFGGKSCYFDGDGDYLDIATSSDFTFGTGAFTIDFWAFVPSDRPAEYHTFTETRIVQGAAGFGFGISTTHKLYFYSNGDFRLTDATALGLGAWHHLAAIGNGQSDGSRNIKMYKDGSYVGTWTTNYNFTNNVFRIGTDIDSGTDDYYGYIDELRVSKGIVRWTTDFTPPTSPY